MTRSGLPRGSYDDDRDALPQLHADKPGAASLIVVILASVVAVMFAEANMPQHHTGVQDVRQPRSEVTGRQ